MERSEYLDNPLPPVFEQRRTVRVRPLRRSEPQAPILKQLKSQGATDYVALPLLFTTWPCRCAERRVRPAGRLLGSRPMTACSSCSSPSRASVETALSCATRR